MRLTLGIYLRMRREAAFLSIEDVATRFSTEPRYAEHVRAEHLRQIEADVAEPSFMSIVVLGAIYPIDMEVLVAVAAHDRRRPVPVICPGCACSLRSPCIDQVNLRVCRTAAREFCSHCTERSAEPQVAPVIA